MLVLPVVIVAEKMIVFLHILALLHQVYDLQLIHFVSEVWVSFLASLIKKAGRL